MSGSIVPEEDTSWQEISTEAPRSPDGPSSKGHRRRRPASRCRLPVDHRGLRSERRQRRRASTGAAASAGRSRARRRTAAASARRPARSTLGSNYSDAVPKKALQAAVDTFTKDTGITVKVNTVDHGTFQDQISSYLQGTPDDVFTWFSGFRMRFFAAQGLATDISDVWAKVGANYSDAFKVGSTGDDGKQYFIPIYIYPWAVFYRKSVFADKGYTIPTTFDELKTLADEDARRTASSRSPSATRTAGRRWARSTSSTCG